MVVAAGLAQLTTWRDGPAEPHVVASLVGAVVGPLVAQLMLTAVGRRFDRILVATAAMLTSIGTATLHALAQLRGADGAFYQVIAVRHGIFVGVGFLALLVGVILSRRLDWIRRYPFSLLGVAMLLTVATVIYGETVNGARLWLQVGSLQFQPSEVARLLLAGFVAIYLYERRHLVVAPWRLGSFDLPPAPYMLPLVGAVLAAVALLVFQNDLGMAALVVLGSYASIAAVMSSKSSLGPAGAVLAVSALASFAASPRVRDRVAAWLEPWQDPTGRGFQFVQGDYGLAAGGIFGHRSAAVASRVPEVHTDFILVGISTLWGWLTAMAVLALTGVIVCRCASAALHAADGLRSLLALAIGSLIGIQVLLICAGTLRILPLTGLTLPLVSSGGTSMIATLFALGVVVGIGGSGPGEQ